MLSQETFHIMKESNIECFTFKGDSITLNQGDNPELAFVISFISPIVAGFTLAFINTFIIIPYVIQIAALICILVCLFTLFFPIHKVTYEVNLSSLITSGYGPFIKKVGTSDYRKKILDENTFATLSKSERSNFICSFPGHIFYDIYTGTWQKITSIEFVRGPLKRGKRVIGTYVWDVEIYLENGYLHQNIVYPGDFLYGSNVDSNFIPNMRIFNRQIGMPDYFLSPWTDLSFEEHCKIHIIKNHDICNCR